MIPILFVALGVGGAFWLRAQRDSVFVNAARSKLARVPTLGNVAAKLSAQLPLTDVVGPPTRPYGMTPQAFAAFLRACKRVGIHPYRIGQTIGEHPRSVGYHRRDDTLVINGTKIDYCAAVDLGAQDITEAHIQWFLSALTREGFACWYRSGPRWKGGEHIHAIYGALKMKPQLEEQVRDFLRQRRRKGQATLKWEKQFRTLN
ncbi:MAG TPA: hypothetical protein VM821_00110 [Abditibacteriaceae bacterium]|nr:hypothetical protein [Abditibacteriaceae bacterium]